jgi:aspartate-semialdehyde dehydrogenase
MKDGLKVAVVGATGAVGKELLAILEARRFPVRELVLFASARSHEKEVIWNNRSYKCKLLQKGCFDGVQMAFFDASDAISKDWVPHAAEAGAWVVDNSSTFRLDDDVLLVVPEVNGHLLDSHLKEARTQPHSWRRRVVTGPNCVAAPLVMALKPIRDQWGIKRVVLSTYQSTSGAGAAAMKELSEQTLGFLDQKPVRPQAFTHQIAFNCIPHIGGFKEDGYTSEEVKVIAETRKMLEMPQLRISATAVRVPTLSCHAESVNVECERPFQVQEVREALKAQSGIIVLDNPSKNIYPLAMAHPEDEVEGATGKDAVYVGRIRKDPSLEQGLNLWVVSDNLRKGAALNAVQVGESLLKALH